MQARCKLRAGGGFKEGSGGSGLAGCKVQGISGLMQATRCKVKAFPLNRQTTPELLATTPEPPEPSLNLTPGLHQTILEPYTCTRPPRNLLRLRGGPGRPCKVPRGF